MNSMNANSILIKTTGLVIFITGIFIIAVCFIPIFFLQIKHHLIIGSNIINLQVIT